MRAILRGRNSRIETRLQVGDVIAYDKSSRSVRCWRVKNGYEESLEINGDNKLYLPLMDGATLTNIMFLLSACSGLSFERTQTYSSFKNAFILC